MNKEDALKKTRILFWVHTIVAAALVALFETGYKEKNIIDLIPVSLYIVETTGIMLTIILIPLAIKGFSMQVTRAAKNKIPNFIEYYYNKCNARTTILFAVVMMNIALYYTLKNSSFFYCGLLGIAAAIYSYPTKATLNSYCNSSEDKE